MRNYIIPSDNWEQQPMANIPIITLIISYQAITGNNNFPEWDEEIQKIISYQAITGNNNT